MSIVAAVSRDESMLTGGISSGGWTAEGTIVVEPLAHLTSSGEWSGLPCSSRANDTSAGRKNCLKFAEQYLSKPHDYTVISADGYGAAVHASRTTLSECYDYTGPGTYSGTAIQRSAIAVSSTAFFAESVPPTLLDYEESIAVRKALNAFAPKRLDLTEALRVFGIRLEGHNMFVIQRAYSDIANKLQPYKLIFGIGTMRRGQFYALYWKQDSEDEQESLLGTIRLKNGREFLITAVSDPESHFFRVYGIRAGRLTMVYTGGGSSC